MKNFLHAEFTKKLAAAILILLLSTLGERSFAQLTGNIGVGPAQTYTTMAAAIAALNAQGVGAGGVIFNVSAGATFNEPLLTISIATNLPTAANPLVIRKYGTSANPIINITGTGTGVDAGLTLNGISYTTIDGLTIVDVSSSSATYVNEGILLTRASATQGCQHDTIRNCTITLNSNNFGGIDYGSTGIMQDNINAAGTPTTPTTFAGTHSYNSYYSNTINNVIIGFALYGGSGGDARTSTTTDTNNDIGVKGGNNISFGSSVSQGNETDGIVIGNEQNLVVANNVIATVANNATAYTEGIYDTEGTDCTVSYYNNDISLTNLYTAGSGDIMGYTTYGSDLVINFFNNIIENFNVATGMIGFSYSSEEYSFMDFTSGTSANVNVYNNIFRNNQDNSTNVPMQGFTSFNAMPGTFQVYGNQVYGNTCATTFEMFNFYGPVFLRVYSNQMYSNTAAYIYCISLGGNWGNQAYRFTIYNNSFHDLTGTTNVAGLYTYGSMGAHQTAGTVDSIYGNQFYNFTVGAAGCYALYSTYGSCYYIYGNNMHSLTANGGTVIPINISGTTATSIIADNFISDLNVPGGTITSIQAMNLSSGTTGGTAYKVYNNSVYLNQTANIAAGFSSAGLYFGNNTGGVDVQNNFVVNNCTPGSTSGYASVALQLTSASPFSDYLSTSNNNSYYAGTPGAKNLIMYDANGSISETTLGAFQGAVTPRDNNSLTLSDPFNSTTDLHIASGSTSLVVGKGSSSTLTLVPLDIDGQTRATPPCIGADEVYASPDLGLNSLVSPVIAACWTSTASITFQIQNYSATAQNFATNNATISYSVTGTNTTGQIASGSYTISSGTLASGGTMNVTVVNAAYNMTSTGTYIFNASISTTGDVNTSNNTLSPSETISILAPVYGEASSNAICSGNTVYLTASNAVTYTWSPGTYLSSTTGQSVSSTPTSAITYTISGTQSNGCVSTGTLAISLITSPPANPGAITGSSPVCQGQNSVSYSIAPVTGATGYVWTVPSGGTISGSSTGPSINVNYSNTASSGNVTVYSQNCFANSTLPATLAVTVNSLPVASGSISGSATVCQNTSANYSIPIITNVVNYNWTLPTGASITAGANTNSITVSYPAPGAVSGMLSVYGSNTCGNSSTLTLGITVNTIPTISINPPSNALSCGGNGETLTASGSSTSYAWTPSTGLSVSTGASVFANPPSSLTYVVTGTDVNTCTVSTTVPFGVYSINSGIYTIDNTIAPSPTNFTSFTSAVAILPCINGNITFNVKAGDVFTEAPVYTNYTNPNSYQITFVKNGSGADPKLEVTGIGNTDAAFTINGGNNFTFNGIDFADNPSNNTQATYLEYGLLLQGTSVNGCFSNTFENGTITLNTLNSGVSTYDVYVVSAASSNTTTNNNNSFFNNTISGGNYGYYFVGNSTHYDQNNQVGILTGGTSNITGLKTGAFRAISYDYQQNFNAFNNNIYGLTNNSATLGLGIAGGIGLTSTLNTANIYNNVIGGSVGFAVTGTSTGATEGIYFPNGGTTNIYGNTIALSNNTAAGPLVGIYPGPSVNNSTTNIYNNSIGPLATNQSNAVIGIQPAVAGTVTGTVMNIYSNTVSGLSVGGSGSIGAIYCLAPNGALSQQYNVYNNLFSNISIGSNTLVGMVFPGNYVGTESIYGNTITGLTNTTGTITGINVNGGGAATIYNNIISSLSATTATMAGILNSVATTTGSIFGNTISTLTASGAAATVYGINITAGNFSNIYGNSISGITCTSTSASTPVAGINYANATASSTNNIYANTISGVSIGTSATCTSTGQVTGLILTGSTGTQTNNIYKNYIRDINNYTTSTGSAVGLQIACTAGINSIYDNMIYDIRANKSANTSVVLASGGGGVKGIFISATNATTTVPNTKLYYNTVYLNGTASATVAMISTAMYILTQSQTGAIDYRNNIFVNNYTVGSATSKAYGVWYNNATTTYLGLATTCNNNLIYTTGASSGTQYYIFAASTTTATPTELCQTLALYKGNSGVGTIGVGTTRETNAQTYTTSTFSNFATTTSAFFVNPVASGTLGNETVNVHLIATTPTDAINKAQPSLAPVTSDIDGDIRGTGAYNTSTAPTIGADEPCPGIPANPGAFTADPTSVCQGQNGVTYTVPTVASTIFNWTVSPGVTITSGQLTNSIVVNFAANCSTPVTISVVETNGCGSSATPQSVSVTVNPTVTAPGTISGSPAVCNGQSGVVYSTPTISGANTYTWTLPSGWTGSSTTNSITATAGSTGGNISVFGVSAGGCGNGPAVTYPVTVNSLPTISASTGTSPICPGNNTTVSASGGVSYAWAPSASLSGGGIGASLTATPGSSTTYTVTGTNGFGCTATATTPVIVFTAPTIGASASLASICTGGTSSLSATGGVTYIWTPSATLSSSTGSPVTAAPIVANTYTYTVTGTDGNGCTNTNTVTVSLYNSPSASFAGTSGCLNPGVVLDALGSSAGSGSINGYQWKNTGGNISGATASSYSIPSAGTSTYSVVVSNNDGCSSTSSTSSITASNNPTATFTGSSGCLNPGVVLDASGSSAGSGSISGYQWKSTGGNISGATSSAYSIPSAGTSTYSVVVSNSLGCSTTSSTSSLTAYTNPTATFTGSSGCFNPGVVLDASGSSAGSGSISGYQWKNTGGNINGATSSAYSIPSAGTSTYSVVVSNTNNCSATSSTSSVTVYSNPTPSISETDNSGTTANDSKICNLDAATLGVSAYSAYSWSPGSGVTQSITVAPSITTTYTLIVTDANNCTGLTNKAVTVNTLPPVVVTPPNAVCLGTTSTALVASGASTYTWLPATNLTPTAGTSATETVQISALTFYTVTGTDGNNCSVQVLVPVATVPTGGIATPIYSIICSGTTKTLTVTGAAGHDYQWQISSDNVNWTNITGAINTNYTTASGDGVTNKFYRLLAQSNSCWNVASTTAEVDVSIPNIVVTASNVTDNSLTLSWSPTGTGNYTISYSGPSSATLTSVTPAKTITGLTANGTYSITVTQTGVGCAASGTVTGVTTLCAMPTGVTLSSPANSQILVSWTGVVGADYRVYYRPLFSYNTYFTKDVSNASSVLLTKQGNNNLYASTTYEVYLSRLDCPTTGATGQGTNPTNVTTLPNVSCAAPSIDSVRSLCPVQIEVFIHDNGGPNQYNVFIQRITPTILAVNSYGVTGTYFTVNVPYSGDQFLIALEAKCGGAISNLFVWPGNVTIKPLCTSPNNLVLSNPTCHGFTASWNSDQCLSNSASGYELDLRVLGTLNYNSYGVPLPANGIGPNKLIGFVTSGRSYQVFVRSIYNCSGYVTYGPASQVQTITTLSSGCRGEDAQQPEETKPAVQQYAQDNQEVFSLYPNPNNGEFVVDLSRYSMEEDAVRIEVINMIGQTVMTHLTTISGGHMSEFINLPAGTAAGTYIIRLTAGKNIYTTKMNVSK